MTAQQFVDFLEERGILAPHDILSLREQVTASKTPLHPTFIARRLVQLRYLNPYFAKTLLEEAITQYRPASNDNLQLTDDEGDEFVDENNPPKSIPFDAPAEPEPESEIDLRNIVLPVIQEVDLMSDEAVERAMLIPALENRSLLADKLGPLKAFDFSGLPAWQRVVIAFSVTTTLILILVLVLIVLLSA